MLDWSDLDYVTSASIHFASDLPGDAERPEGLIVFRLPAPEPTRAGILEAITVGCRMRSGVPETWDGLYDGLLSLPRSRGYVVAIEGADRLFRENLGVAGRLVTVWLDAVDAFRQVATPLHLVLLVPRTSLAG